MTDDMYNDVSKIFEEEYNKRMLITPSFCTKKLIDLGYRKIPEGGCVLSKEENEMFCKFVSDECKKTRKKTAKEILDDFDNHGVYSKDYTDFMRKEYGVEVE